MREKNINVYFVKPSKQVLYSLYMNMIKHLNTSLEKLICQCIEIINYVNYKDATRHFGQPEYYHNCQKKKLCTYIIIFEKT